MLHPQELPTCSPLPTCLSSELCRAGALNLLFAFISNDPGLDAMLVGDISSDSVTLEITVLDCASTLAPFPPGRMCTDAGQAQKASAWATFLPRGALVGMTLGTSKLPIKVGRIEAAPEFCCCHHPMRGLS